MLTDPQQKLVEVYGTQRQDLKCDRLARLARLALLNLSLLISKAFQRAQPTEKVKEILPQFRQLFKLYIYQTTCSSSDKSEMDCTFSSTLTSLAAAGSVDKSRQ